MAERTESTHAYRCSISVEATERELRRCGFALLNHYLTMHQVIAEHVHLPPVEMLILIATTTGNVQRALRPGSLPEALRGSVVVVKICLDDVGVAQQGEQDRAHQRGDLITQQRDRDACKKPQHRSLL